MSRVSNLRLYTSSSTALQHTGCVSAKARGQMHAAAGAHHGSRVTGFRPINAEGRLRSGVESHAGRRGGDLNIDLSSATSSASFRPMSSPPTDDNEALGAAARGRGATEIGKPFRLLLFRQGTTPTTMLLYNAQPPRARGCTQLYSMRSARTAPFMYVCMYVCMYVWMDGCPF